MPVYTGDAFKDFILAVVGNIVIAALGVGVATYWAKAQWGQMMGFLLGAVAVAAVVYTPDKAIALLRAIGDTFFTAPTTPTP